MDASANTGLFSWHVASIEKQLIVQCSVIGNPTVFIHDFLPAGAIGNYLESDFIAGHYADLDSLLAACQLPDYIAFNFHPPSLR